MLFYKICPAHGKHFRSCKACSPKTAITAALRKAIRGALLRKGAIKTQSSLEYLGAPNWDTVINMIQRKILRYNRIARVKITGMNFDLDHIKPLAAFAAHELHMANHWTNLQPLPPAVNRKKNGKWSAQDDKIWKKKIYLNPKFADIYLPA